MMMRHNLFAVSSDPHGCADPPIDPLHDLSARLSDACRCGWSEAVIGKGDGLHRAAIFCSRCERPRGWLPDEAHAFVAEILKRFGRPTTAINIRRKNGEQK